MTMWNEEKVRFMRDAAEYGGFYGELAARASKYIDGGDCVCDAGCGLGYLSLALLPLCRRVTAIDCSGEALSVLRELGKDERRLRIIEGDVFQTPEDELFDEMIFCFFGSVPEVLSTAKTRCKKRALLFRKDWETRRFSLSEEPVRSQSFSHVCGELDRLGLTYKKESFLLDMGQPFRTLADAKAFFSLYNDGAPEDGLPPLEKTASGDFEYYLPALRSVGMITLETGDIPEKYENLEVKR